MIPTGTLVEGLQTIARLPRDIDAHARKAHPDDGEAMRRLATALAIRGRIKDAARRPDRSRLGARHRPGLRSLGLGLQHARRRAPDATEELREAADWFKKAAGVAKRPIDVYDAIWAPASPRCASETGRPGHPGVRRKRPPGWKASRAANASSPRPDDQSGEGASVTVAEGPAVLPPEVSCGRYIIAVTAMT